MPEIHPKSQPKIDIEKEMNDVVRRIGGEVVVDLLPSNPSELGANADYIFRADGTVCELKCLQKKSSDDEDFRKKVGNAVKSLMDKGHIPKVTGTCRVSVDTQKIKDRDPEAFYELIKPYRVRLGRVLHKANKQIELTASHFKIANSLGLLLMANEADFAFEPKVVEPLLIDLLPRCPAINTVVMFTEKITVKIPGLPFSAPIWAPMTPVGRPPVPQNLLTRLGEGWVAHYFGLLGLNRVSVTTHSGSNITDVEFTEGNPMKLVIDA